jgi:hypothetical protein
MASIPASAIVSVIPSVISAGGSALDLIGLCLTENTRVPTGQVLSFPSQAAVADYFGPTSVQASQATKYFGGFEGSTVLPGAMLFAQCNLAAVPGYLRGGDISGLTLAELQAFSGTLTINFAGAPLTSSTINLSAATSFSNAATIIQAAFTSPSFGVTFDSVSGAFVFTSTATGATETIVYATGTLAANLLLTQQTGAILSQGAAAVTSPPAFMGGIVDQTTNWATFFTDFDPDAGSGNALKLEFAQWAGTTGNRYAYLCEDSDVTPTESTNAPTSLGQLVAAAQISGVAPIWVPSIPFGQAAFASGAIASIDFEATNGETTLAFKSQSGLTATVTSQTVADNLMSNGYNFYGAYATANDQFIFFYPGSISGPFKWIDAYVGQIWLNNALQLALMELLTQVKSIPYTPAGYGLIAAAMQDPITAAVNFGLISPNVTLSAAQIAEVNNQAGTNVANTLQSQGWYLQIQPASAQTRGARQSPTILFWYCQGGSVQQITLSSIEVQ